MIRAFQWDLARQPERLAWLLRQLPRYADWGYTEVYLHLEDAVEYPRLPQVARPGAYRMRDLERLAAAARRVGIGVVPIANLLGHTQYLIKVPGLRALNECVDADGRPLERGQICPLHPRTIEVADKILADLTPLCTAGKIHVGLDESYHLGRHPRSRAEVEEVGLAGHFGRYVRRLHGLCEARKLQMGLWADLLALLPAAIDWVPAGTAAYDWYYYPFRKRPAIELHNFREYDLAPALRRRGIEYWACPMSGPFRYEPLPTFGDRLENIRDWWDRANRVKATGLLVTQWETQRVAAPLVQAVDAAAASLWRTGTRSPPAMLAAGFGDALGARRPVARRMAAAALAADRYPYAGYFRWEIDLDWRHGARGGAADRAREARHFARLERRLRGLPEPLAASLRFRSYLAQRDAWVAAWAAGGAPVRARLRNDAVDLAKRFVSARASAQVMWSSSRSGPSPQARSVRRDAQQLKAALKAGGSGACLRFQVENFAPALQQVVVEAQDGSDGPWRLLRGRHTMEFTRIGGRRRASNLMRALAVPLPDPWPARVRVAVRGLGEVRVSGFEIVPGGRRFAVNSGRAVRLGTPAPAGGFPELDWSRNSGPEFVLELPPA
ncbi:MAG TPA: family 20 glycosylhydrolase [Opitutaceae bacterium]